MINGLRPYPEMKSTGLSWLGDVPAHWDVRRNGRLFGARRETGFPDLPVLEVSIRSGVRVRDFDAGGRKQEMSDRSKYQRAVRGDIAYNMMRMWQGAVGIAPVDGLVSPAYVVARPFPEIDAAYYAYLFRTATYMREIDTFSRGIVPDRNRLYWESFKQMPSAYPPLKEQRLIARFLDWHGVQTEKLVRAKKRVIALLNEEKQAIVHRAVTRGLDPNVKLKPSGVPWLGDVPEWWEVTRLGRLLNLTAGFAFKSSGFTDADVDIRLLRGINVSPGKIRWQAVVRWPADNAEVFSDFSLRIGDIVIGMDRPIIQSGIRIARVSNEDIPSLLLQRVARIRFFPEVDEQFGFMILGGKSFVDYLTPIFSGISVPHISPRQISDFRFALPSIDEQRKIVEAISFRTADVTSALNRIEREIALIQEFRARLIADVVTGKLDVRITAAALPEVTDLEAVGELTEDDDLDKTAETEDEELAA